MKQKLSISIAAYLISLGVLVGFLGVVGPAMAQDGAGATDSEGPVEGSRDPLSFRSSLEIKNKYVDVDGGNSNTTIFRGKHAFSGDFYVRLDMPVVGSHLPKRGGAESLDVGLDPHRDSFGGGDSHETGLGDILLRAMFRVMATYESGFGLGVGSELIFDTATEDELGSGKYQFVPVLAAGFSPMEGLRITPTLKDYISFAGDADRPNINELSFNVKTLYSWPKGWWTALDPTLKVNFQNDNKRTLILYSEGGKMLNENVSAWVRPGIHVAGEERMNWSVEVGIRYTFK